MSSSRYSSSSVVPNGQTGPNSRPLTCSDCGRTFSRHSESGTPLSSPHPSALTRHLRGHRDRGPSRCPTCSIRRVSKGPVLHTRNRSHLHPHSCTLCNKTFISSAHLSVHLQSHTGDRKHRCGVCCELFRQASHLMRHKSIHSADRPFKCPECGKCFGRASQLKTHGRVHTGEKPFRCSVCDKGFTQKAGLIMHYRLHTGERPARCDRSSAHLLSHQAQDSAGQRLSCGPSRKTFRSVSEPRRRQNTQGCPEDLQCGVCCRSFVRSSYLQLCSGQRPYHCKVCNKTFAKMATFERHCEKHLRQSRGNDEEEEEEEEVRPPLLPLLPSPLSPPSSSSLPPPSEVSTRS